MLDTASDRESPVNGSRALGLAWKTSIVVGVAAGISAGLVAFLLRLPMPGITAAVATTAAAGAGFFVVRALIVKRLVSASDLADHVRELGVPGDKKSNQNGDEIDRLTASLEHASESVAARIARLRRIENYRQEFLGDVSHELQTPIFAVEGFAETLLEGALEDPNVNRTFVEKIHRNARRLSALVNDLSDISQIETGSLRMNLVLFDPKQLAQESVESLEISAEHAEVRLYSFVSQGVASVVGDRERVRQVLLNLITNGIKYNNPGGSVELAVWQSDERSVTFSVTDDGIGIAPDDIPRVTERFYRVDKSRSRERGGTGLGLAIVKHIVEAHGSALLIQSKPGHGSTFSFALATASNPAPPTNA